MTIIVANKHEMIADGQMTSCLDFKTSMNTKKIYKIRFFGKQIVFGCAGAKSFPKIFIEELKKANNIQEALNEAQDRIKYWQVVIYHEGSISVSTSDDVERALQEYVCLGTGANYAQGALDAGATPLEAVKIACRRNLYCGGKIQRVKLK